MERFLNGTFKLLLGMLLSVALLTVGCGPSDKDILHISGNVTYEGKPVKYGTIMFEPDSSKGGSGAPGTAIITDGKFDTKTNGSPAKGGPQIVTIQGVSGEGVSEYAPYGNMLAGGKAYIKPFDFPASGTIQQDFDLDEVLKRR